MGKKLKAGQQSGRYDLFKNDDFSFVTVRNMQVNVKESTILILK